MTICSPLMLYKNDGAALYRFLMKRDSWLPGMLKDFTGINDPKTFGASNDVRT